MSSSRDSKSLERSPEFPPLTIQRQQATAPVNALEGVMTDIGDSRVTERAHKIRVSTDEEMVWQAAPSLLLLIPRAVKYAIIMAVIVAACSYVVRLEGKAKAGLASVESSLSSSRRVPQSTSGRKSGNHSSRPKIPAPAPSGTGSPSVGGAAPEPITLAVEPAVERFNRYLRWFQYCIAAIFLIRLGIYLLELKTTRYQASSQRLTIESGIRHTYNVPFELHELGDAIIVKPLLLRPFGVAHLRVARRVLPAALAQPVMVGHTVVASSTVVTTRSGIATRPFVDLRGIRNAHLVRDILRQGGQIEAQRPDKIRFR